MQMEFEDAKNFKSALDAIVNLIDEGMFEISPNGLHLRAMDPSQIAMVDFNLKSDATSKFNVEKDTKVALNLINLDKVLSRARSGEKLALNFDEKKSKLAVEFYGNSKRTFTLNLLEPEAQIPREPNVSFDATIKLRGGEFKNLLKDALLLSSHIILYADENKFSVEAHGDSGELHVETPKDSENIKEIKAKQPARAMFPVEYLDNMTKACADDEIIELNLKADAPVKLSYRVWKAELSYYLAPRVESL